MQGSYPYHFAKPNVPATQSCMLSASRTLHSSVHLVKAVGMLERVPVDIQRISFSIKYRCGLRTMRFFFTTVSLILTCLSPCAALLMEEVVQQLLIRASDDVHILISNQEAGTTTRLQWQRAGQLQNVCSSTWAQQSLKRKRKLISSVPRKACRRFISICKVT